MLLQWLRLHQEVIAQEARAAFPDECCGFLLGTILPNGWRLEEARPATNVSPHPRIGYLLDGKEQVTVMKYAEARGLEVIGYYHSHPNGRRGPSPTDFILAGGDRSFLTPQELSQLPPELRNLSTPRLPDHSVQIIVALSEGRVLECSAWQLRDDLSRFDRITLEFLDENLKI